MTNARTTKPPKKKRVAILASGPIEAEALALYIEFVAHAKVVLRSFDAVSLGDRLRVASIELLIVASPMAADDACHRLFQFADAGRFRAAILGGADHQRSDGVEVLDKPRSLVRWMDPEKCTDADQQHADRPERLRTVVASISTRERQVWQLIAEGHSVRSVAERLELAESTIDSHKSRLMKKLGVHKSVDLVLLAVRLGLVDL